MNSSTEDGVGGRSAMDSEATLRLIATLPAPDGIEDRMKAGLKAAMRTAPRQGSVIHWPQRLPDGARWSHLYGMRSAAAAAIVLVVAGGGWEVYSHIRVAPQPAAIAVPESIGGTSGLSAAGAMRTPRTVEGPVVAVPARMKQKSAAVEAKADPQIHVVKKSKSVAAAQR